MVVRGGNSDEKEAFSLQGVFPDTLRPQTAQNLVEVCSVFGFAVVLNRKTQGIQKVWPADNVSVGIKNCGLL